LEGGIVPTQRARRIEELTDLARKGIKREQLIQAASYFPLSRDAWPLRSIAMRYPAVRAVVIEAKRRYQVTDDTAESYAEAVFVALKPKLPAAADK
jgi:hypothetical protein